MSICTREVFELIKGVFAGHIGIIVSVPCHSGLGRESRKFHCSGLSINKGIRIETLSTPSTASYRLSDVRSFLPWD